MLPPMRPHQQMTDEQRYIFDLQGYIVLKNVVSPEVIAEVNQVMDWLEGVEPEDLPYGVSHGKTRSESELYLSNMVEAHPIFHQFIDHPAVIPIIREITLGLYRLNHAYAIYRWGEGYTYMHMQNTPMHPKATYHCQNGEMFSLTSKSVFPISNHNAEDGCFAAIPGSHKANFVSPFGVHPDENPNLVPIEAQPGDCIIFTEALTHGSYVNTSQKPRRTIYYCYSVGYMPDWSKFGLQFSDRFWDTLTPEQREIVRRKDN
jgi:ectoine hydroxylase-related dioxygenase (phytanoyl-CoA dioxygenase family)